MARSSLMSAGSTVLIWAAEAKAELLRRVRMRCSNSGWSAKNCSMGWKQLPIW